jgi:hypothetical protein
MQHIPRQIESLTYLDGHDSEAAFVVFASPEKRCLGAARLMRDYRPDTVCLLEITDEENKLRDDNIRELKALFGFTAHLQEVPMRHSDPILGMEGIVKAIRRVTDPSSPVTIDISTFPRDALLLTLRALSLMEQPRTIRLIYTEPARYIITQLRAGLRQVKTVPTYVAPYHADREIRLIIFLGFERDRALGLWESVEPHETIAIIGRPAYHDEWAGEAERINAALLSRLPASNIRHVDPRDPFATSTLLESILIDGGLWMKHNYYVAPLGTKPETVGLSYYWLKNPGTSTVIYASPIERNHEYISEDIGRTWVLPNIEWPS